MIKENVYKHRILNFRNYLITSKNESQKAINNQKIGKEKEATKALEGILAGSIGGTIAGEMLGLETFVHEMAIK